MTSETSRRVVQVWDLPLRVFHWALVVLVVVSIVSVNIGGNAMEIHEMSGCAILTLVIFRVCWGFVGGWHARFRNFVRGPAEILRYLRTAGAAHTTGHNPLGALSVLAMIVCLLVQAATGLFANDDIMMEGPLVKWITKETSDLITHVHHTNAKILIALIALHLAAIFYYVVIKRNDILRAMFSGQKLVTQTDQSPSTLGALLPRALSLLLLTALLVYALVA